MARERGEVVLVVDDNEHSLYTKSRILRREGFEVFEAQSGAEALAHLTAHHPRLVVLDVVLPDASGWDLCQRIKADPATASTLVLQTSATYTREEDTVRALEWGADACLTEPTEAAVLVATVRALLRARRAEDEVRAAYARADEARVAAERANRMKDEFLATLSHELRSPLGAILTWASLLKAGLRSESDVERAVDAIERNARLQAKLIEDLLDVSRIESSKMHLELGPTDVTAALVAALDGIRTAREAKSIALDVELEPDLGLVWGDGARLQQVFWNLLANAVKFTPEGGRIEVRMARAGESVATRITDSGQGIEPHFLPHIFERFRQADASTTRSQGGLGLGLAIARSLVELHGGSIDARSAGLGHGATFVVTLPAGAAPGAGEVGEARASQAGGAARLAAFGGLAGVKVLVVDDEDDNREAMSEVLRRCGAEVRAAASVRRALALLAEGEPDLVLTDIAMPVEDGFALLREVRDHGQRTGRELPVVALTAFASLPEQRRLVSAGFDAQLAKPVDSRTLAETIRGLVSGSAGPESPALA